MVEINQIYHDDCIKLMERIPDNFIDLIVTSPPYNIGIKYDNYADNMDWHRYYTWLTNCMTELYRITKQDGRVCINHYLSMGQSNNRHSPLMRINEIAGLIGFNHHAVAIWEDRTLTNRTAWGSWLSASAPYINSPYEGILILYKNRWKKDKQGTTQITDKEFIEACSGVWRLTTERNRDTPAPFPLRLAERCILLLSYEGDLVFDPFMGSGTTAKAAKKWGRNYIGCDISKKYCNLAKLKLTENQLF